LAAAIILTYEAEQWRLDTYVVHARCAPAAVTETEQRDMHNDTHLR